MTALLDPVVDAGSLVDAGNEYEPRLTMAVEDIFGLQPRSKPVTTCLACSQDVPAFRMLRCSACGNEFDGRLGNCCPGCGNNDCRKLNRETTTQDRDRLQLVNGKLKKERAEWWRQTEFTRQVEFLKSLVASGEIEDTFDDAIEVLAKPWEWHAEFVAFEAGYIAENRDANDADDRRKMLV